MITLWQEYIRAENDISIWKIDGSSSTFPFWDFDFEQKPMANEAVLTLSYPSAALKKKMKNFYSCFKSLSTSLKSASVLFTSIA